MKQKKELNFIIQFNYGYGWEDVSWYPCGIRQVNFSKAYRQAKEDLKEYIYSSDGSYRLIKRYEEFVK